MRSTVVWGCLCARRMRPRTLQENEWAPNACPLQPPALLDDIIAAALGDMLLLDNIEILFDTALQQDPLSRLQAVSRSHTVVAAWNGAVTRDDRGQPSLIYAAPGHPEYRHYPAADLVLIESSATP